MKETTKEELAAQDGHYMRVCDIREFLARHNPPDDAIVLIEQVEDKYFDGGCDISGYSGQLEDGTHGILPEGSRTSEWPVVLHQSQPPTAESRWLAMPALRRG